MIFSLLAADLGALGEALVGGLVAVEVAAVPADAGVGLIIAGAARLRGDLAGRVHGGRRPGPLRVGTSVVGVVVAARAGGGQESFVAAGAVVEAGHIVCAAVLVRAAVAL